MKLRDFYEFNSHIKNVNDLVKATCVFLIDKNTMNSLIEEFNSNNDRKLKKFEYNGLGVNFYDNAISKYLERLGVTQDKDTVKDIYNTDLGNLEIINVCADEYNGIVVEMKMSEDIFSEYKKYFMCVETHDTKEFVD